MYFKIFIFLFFIFKTNGNAIYKCKRLKKEDLEKKRSRDI